MSPHPIKTKLDDIIYIFYKGGISSTEAEKLISDAVDDEVSRNPKIMYQEIIILGQTKQNALNRLKRKQKLLENMMHIISENRLRR